MPEESFQERTEQATPKRREEARKKGQVAKSRELASVSVLLAGTFTLFWGSSYFFTKLILPLKYYLGNLHSIKLFQDNIQALMLLGVRQYLIFLAPLLLVLTAVAVLSNYFQIGTLFSAEPLKPKLSKISPLEGIKRLFSMQSLMEFVKSLLKLLIVGWIVYVTVKAELPQLVPLLDQSPIQIFTYFLSISFAIFWKTCLVMIFIAVLDYGFQRWQFEKNLRMTKQEVKEEYKQTEGDPQVKARIRSIQREMARKRMMAEVPEADVVITNPTRLAIALKYKAGSMEAPKVVAKGSGVIAEKIREIARKHRVPVVENKPLAQSLYKLVDVGSTIPEQLYQAVAEVFAYIYRLRGRKGTNSAS